MMYFMHANEPMTVEKGPPWSEDWNEGEEPFGEFHG